MAHPGSCGGTACPARSLAQDVEALEPGLGRVILAVADAVAQCAAVLRELGHDNPLDDQQHGSATPHRTENVFGDAQCTADLATDEAFWSCLRSTGVVACGCSEERPDPEALLPAGSDGTASRVYSVAWDPLDGSSVVDASFAVGSIVGIWPGDTLTGRTVADQAAAAYAVYGPRTVLVVATRSGSGGARDGGEDGSVAATVHEYLLLSHQGGTPTWRRSRSHVRVKPCSVFYAPANVRCCADNEAYRDLLHAWMAGPPPVGCAGKSMTLRYSGALVADVHHILTKGGGCFVCPGSSGAPSKLRMAFEAAPMAFIVHAAGGTSLDGRGQSLLEARIDSCQQRTALCLGSAQLVAQCEAAMRA